MEINFICLYKVVVRLKGNCEYLFNKYLLNFYYMSGTVLDAGDTEANKRDKILTLMHLHSNRGRQSNKLLANHHNFLHFTKTTKPSGTLPKQWNIFPTEDLGWVSVHPFIQHIYFLFIQSFIHSSIHSIIHISISITEHQFCVRHCARWWEKRNDTINWECHSDLETQGLCPNCKKQHFTDKLKWHSRASLLALGSRWCSRKILNSASVIDTKTTTTYWTGIPENDLKTSTTEFLQLKT